MRPARCPWCGGAAWFDEVDVGVGSVQVGPATCGCGASQLYGAEMIAHVDPHEWKRGWVMGPNSTDGLIYRADSDEWLTPEAWYSRMGNDYRSADTFPEDVIVFMRDARWNVVHECRVDVGYERGVFFHIFITRCDRVFKVSPTNPQPAPTCLACLIRS